MYTKPVREGAGSGMNWVFYALFGAALLHVVEEYAFPGGFSDFMREMAGRFAQSVNTAFAVIINGLFLILCLAVALFSAKALIFDRSKTQRLVGAGTPDGGT
jgi:hypothetical protein